MADRTAIEWTDATWNPVTGCSVISPGCKNCYAMKLAGTRLKHVASRRGLTKPSNAGPVWNGQVRFNEAELLKPLSWKRPRLIFVCAHGDLFHEAVPDEWIDRVFAVAALCPQHTFQVLTKRADRMREYVGALYSDFFGRLQETWNATQCRVIEEVLSRHRERVLADGMQCSGGTRWRFPLPNVWLGVSAEDQARADERIPLLLDTPAAVRFLSAEPLLGLLNIKRYLCGCRYCVPESKGIGRAGFPASVDQVIVGGESGPGARPMHPDWVRSLRDQCAPAGTAFFFKQWGEHAAVYDRDRDDPDWQRCDQVARRTPRGRWLNITGGHGFHNERVVRVDRVGKKAAGRLLDGIEHNGMPSRA